MPDVTMPKLSDTMEEGKILRWLKQPGEKVAIGDVLAEVETDKANMELEAFDEGVLSEVRVKEGESAPVGAVIAVLAPADAGRAVPRPAAPVPAAAAPAAAAESRRKPEPAMPAKSASRPSEAPPVAVRGEGRPEAARESWRPTVVGRREATAETEEAESVKASPRARRLAREHEVDLASLAGTGPGGRIVEKDIEAAIAARGTTPKKEAAPAAAAPRGGERRMELSRLRRTTAKRMSESKREVPHFYVSADIRMDEAVRLKDALAGLGGEFEGITFTHLVLKAVGVALTRVPEANASYDGDAMVLHDRVNVGLATSVEQGLIVPVVHDCDRQPLGTIVQQARAVVERARAGRFESSDLSGGTFTLSNLGMYPVSQFAAVINPPQAAILAVGTIREVPVVDAERVVPGRMMTVTLSCDHRIIDGVIAGRFLAEVRGLLERPLALVV